MLIFLIKTRLDAGVFFDNQLDKSVIESTYNPAVTIPLLVENAIKHNTYNPDNPLKIRIKKERDYIVTNNTYNPRSVLDESTKKGLKNISEPYDLIFHKKVEVLNTENEFIVKIPILKRNDYERKYEELNNVVSFYIHLHFLRLFFFVCRSV